MKTGDLNSLITGLQARLNSRIDGLSVCYCTAHPTRQHIHCGTQPIKVNGIWMTKECTQRDNNKYDK
jgi:hypothetical protein